MSVNIRCPACQRLLQLREDHMGQQVQCPSCGQVFTAEPPAPERPPPPPPPVLLAEPAPPQYERRFDDLDAERRDLAYRGVPHRGGLILTLGILGLVFSCCPLAGWILGGMALSMGGDDLRQMALGGMDRSGQGLTQAGRIIGIIAVIFATISCVTNGVLRLGGGMR